MGDVVTENPLNVVPPHKKQVPSNIPSIDIEGFGNDDSDEYSTLKKLQRHLESDSSDLFITLLMLTIRQIYKPARGIHQR